MIYTPIIGIVGLIFAGIIFRYVKSRPAGTDLMKEIAGSIHHGARVFLKREYSVLIVFIAAVFVLLTIFLRKESVPNLGIYTAIAFLAGAGCSMLAGFLGMSAATERIGAGTGTSGGVLRRQRDGPFGGIAGFGRCRNPIFDIRKERGGSGDNQRFRDGSQLDRPLRACRRRDIHQHSRYRSGLGGQIGGKYSRGRPAQPRDHSG